MILRLSLATLRERWPLFIGAATILAFGVALIAGSLFVMLGTGNEHPPGAVTLTQASHLREMYAGAATVMDMNVLVTLFMAFLMTASTFSFITAHRRQELALLRLMGASRGQVIRLLLGEALVTGLVASALGIPLSLPATLTQQELLVRVGMLPPGFHAPWGHLGLLLFCALTGSSIALISVFGSARRAARLTPLEAYQATGRATRVMTRSRWVLGLGSFACTLGLITVAQRGDLLIALLVGLCASMSGSLAAVMLSPLLVPLTGRVFGLVLSVSVLGRLAEANVLDNVRRNTALSAPLVVLVGCLLGLSGTLASQSRATGEQEARLLNADLVVRSTLSKTQKLQQLSGGHVVSTEVTLPASLTKGKEVQYLDVVAVEPRAYRMVHRLQPRRGSLSAFTDRTLVLGPGFLYEDSDIRVGDVVSLNVAGNEQSFTVVAAMPETLDTTVQLLVPSSHFPSAVLELGEVASFIKVGNGIQNFLERLHGERGLQVSSVTQWASQKTKLKDRENHAMMIVLVALATLYAVIVLVSTVVISATERRKEYQMMRLAGLAVLEVVTVNIIEGVVVVIIGLTLGLIVTLGALSGIAGATKLLIGAPILVFPWEGLIIISVGALSTVGLSAGFTALRMMPANDVLNEKL